MPDVQNFFHVALAVIIAKRQYLYIDQKKAFGELYRALKIMRRRSACTAPTRKTNIFVKVIQWDKLWYAFPVITVSHYGERAVSFKMVDLPKSLL